MKTKDAQTPPSDDISLFMKDAEESDSESLMLLVFTNNRGGRRCADNFRYEFIDIGRGKGWY